MLEAETMLSLLLTLIRSCCCPAVTVIIMMAALPAAANWVPPLAQRRLTLLQSATE